MNHLIYRALSKLNVVDHIRTHVNLSINGNSLSIPLWGRVGGENLFPNEPWLDDKIELLLRHQPSGAFIDVGVNLGQTLLKFLQYRDRNQYLGFEPNPYCAAYVEELKKENCLQNVTLFPVGLSDVNRIVRLLMSSEYDSCASTVAGFRRPDHYNSYKYVPVFKGDDLLSEIQEISVIKIDVEGGELEVLKGLENTIQRTRPAIICEVLPIYEEPSYRRERVDELLRILTKHNYKIARILRNGQTIPLDTIDTHSDLSLCEYIFFPATMKTALIANTM